MDPLSVAGLGLGITSLVIQLLGGCIKGYEVFLSIIEMPSNFEHLRLRMRLEQSRLLNWGEKVGLLEDALKRPSLTLQLHRNLITDVLLEIQRLFKNCLKIETQFDHVGHFKDNEPLGHTGEILLQPPERRTLLSKALKAWEKTAQIPTRLQWALVKQDKFEHLVGKLISYNDAMMSLLDSTTAQQLYDIQMQNQLVLLQLSSKVDDLKQLAHAIQIQTQDRDFLLPGTLSNRTGADTAQMADQASFVRLANFKALEVRLEMNHVPASVQAVDRELISLTGTSGTRAMASYKGEKVWVEWKEYDDEHQVPSWPQMVEARIRKLAMLLGVEDTPEEFKAPHCRGYFHDNDDEPRYGMIYRAPKESPGAKLMSLSDQFKQNAKPSLTDRVNLAHVISRSIMYLHSVNWLHKGIRSENIVFFTPPGRMPDYSSPTIAGFEYARPDLPEELTEKPAENFEHDLYRHRDAIGQSTVRSKKSWDVYSLGVVLVEIAFWRSIGDILDLRPESKNARSKLRRIGDMLLQDDFVDSIGMEAGERYKSVVRRCIRGGTELGVPEGADEANPEIGAGLHRTFSQVVVEKLKSIDV